MDTLHHPLWARRTLLKSAGTGTLALAGLTALPQPHGWAAGEQTRFVATWNAPDIIDPHVKYDVGAAAFNLNIYVSALPTGARTLRITRAAAWSIGLGSSRSKTWRSIGWCIITASPKVCRMRRGRSLRRFSPTRQHGPVGSSLRSIPRTPARIVQAVVIARRRRWPNVSTTVRVVG